MNERMAYYNEREKIKKFLRTKVAQYFHVIVEKPVPIGRNPYKVVFYPSFYGMGANSGCIALCSWQRQDIEFNMKKVMWNKDNLPGLEALVIHEVCHIVSPQKNGAHGPVFEKLYQRYAGDLAPAIETLVI